MLRFAPLLLLAGAAAAGDVYEAPHPEPTAEEVEILEWMNRFRADPGGEAARIAEHGRGAVYGRIDWEMFLDECRELEPSPPLVFDLALLDAARKHSHYMVLHGLGHGEDPSMAGYTGKSFGARAKTAGYRGGPRGENCFRDARGAQASHIGFVVDFGKGGPGGMQPGRGHRRNMHSPGSNQVGPGAVPHDGRLSVTHVFGRSKGRFAGGVVYTDRNRNGRFDAGEGRGGVTVATHNGKHSTTTWASGGYTLEVPQGKALLLVAEFADLSYREEFAAGDDNVKFDWAIPATADLELADRLLEQFADVDPDDEDEQGRLVDLYLATRHLGLDPERREKVDAILGDVGERYEAMKADLLAKVDAEDFAGFRDAARDAKRAWRGGEGYEWIRGSERLAKAASAVAGLKRQAETRGKKVGKRDYRKLIEAFEAAIEAEEFADLRGAYTALLAEARAVEVE